MRVKMKKYIQKYARCCALHPIYNTLNKKKYEEIIDFYFQWEVLESIFKLINLYFIYRF